MRKMIRYILVVLCIGIGICCINYSLFVYFQYALIVLACIEFGCSIRRELEESLL